MLAMKIPIIDQIGLSLTFLDLVDKASESEGIFTIVSFGRSSLI